MNLVPKVVKVESLQRLKHAFNLLILIHFCTCSCFTSVDDNNNIRFQINVLVPDSCLQHYWLRKNSSKCPLAEGYFVNKQPDCNYNHPMSVFRCMSIVNFSHFLILLRNHRMKSDRKQERNVLYQVCVFRAVRKNKFAAKPLIAWELIDLRWTYNGDINKISRSHYRLWSIRFSHLKNLEWYRTTRKLDRSFETLQAWNDLLLFYIWFKTICGMWSWACAKYILRQ